MDILSIGVDRIQRNFEAMRKQVEAWKGARLPDESAKLVIYQAFVEGKLDAPKHSARRLHDQYFYPQAEEFAPRTVWSVSKGDFHCGVKVDVKVNLPVHPVTPSLRVSFPDGRASKESPFPKPFRRIAPNVESDAASAPACWISDIRTDVNPRPA